MFTFRHFDDFLNLLFCLEMSATILQSSQNKDLHETELENQGVDRFIINLRENLSQFHALTSSKGHVYNSAKICNKYEKDGFDLDSDTIACS